MGGSCPVVWKKQLRQLWSALSIPSTWQTKDFRIPDSWCHQSWLRGSSPCAKTPIGISKSSSSLPSAAPLFTPPTFTSSQFPQWLWSGITTELTPIPCSSAAEQLQGLMEALTSHPSDPSKAELPLQAFSRRDFDPHRSLAASHSASRASKYCQFILFICSFFPEILVKLLTALAKVELFPTSCHSLISQPWVSALHPYWEQQRQPRDNNGSKLGCFVAASQLLKPN